MPFDLTPFMPVLHGKLDRLRPLLKNRVGMPVQRHRHLNAVFEERAKPVEVAVQERHERRHFERHLAGGALAALAFKALSTADRE